MTNPASPIFAKLLMIRALSDITENMSINLPFIKLYVDDIGTSIPINSADTIVDEFNSFNVNLQIYYTIEKG